MPGLPLQVHLSNRAGKTSDFKRPVRKLFNATAIVRFSVKSEVFMKIMSPDCGNFGI